jgi:hypothetical protein
MSAPDTRAAAKNRPAPGWIATRDDRPATTMIAAVITHSTTTPATRPHRAWAVARPRVVAPVSRSSHRPASSSPRSDRVPDSRPHTAPRMLRVRNVLRTVNPAFVCSIGAGPKRAMMARFDPKAVARASRWARVL